MTERELLTRFLDYIYHLNDKSAQYTAIGSFLEEGNPSSIEPKHENPSPEQAVCSRCGRYNCEENET